MTANAVPYDAGCTRCVALRHLVDEQAAKLEQTEAERDRYKNKVHELTNKLAAGAMAVHSDPDPI